MSDSDELARLRADLEVLERHESYSLIENARCDVEDKIVDIEAAADPWRDVKNDIEDARQDPKHHSTKRLVAYIDHLTAEVARLTARLAEMENPDASDPDSFTLGDFAVLKTAQEIIRYAMDRNPDLHDDTKICRRAIWAISQFSEHVRMYNGLKRQLPYRWGSLGRDTGHILDMSYADSRESPADYDPDACRTLADMHPPFEGPIVGFDPVLEPDRVLATAAEALKTVEEKRVYWASNLAKAFQCLERSARDAKPYRLKGGESDQA